MGWLLFIGAQMIPLDSVFVAANVFWSFSQLPINKYLHLIQSNGNFMVSQDIHTRLGF